MHYASGAINCLSKMSGRRVFELLIFFMGMDLHASNLRAQLEIIMSRHDFPNSVSNWCECTPTAKHIFSEELQSTMKQEQLNSN